MLETKNLVKIYKPKRGVPVRALDGISIRFPDKGMVFLLGKSGSGKSTLLNVLGGLDKYDSGEILIKGVSSKTFKQKDFDSYRNTYVGFIFQEYNVLEEFTVGANIALALELQGKKATDAELNNILEQVDLAGYGNRRPNELSGGQKQRVAIARALVKNPKIIMADEPSGALDSETGKQVFETLKKLSKEKLVIVVSHDRDFAMEYADRIIELADGKVISDISYISENPDYVEEQPEEIQKSIVFEDDCARIPMGYHLTEEDRIAINEYIDKLNGEAVLRFGDGEEAQKEKIYRNKFAPTTEESIKNEDKSPLSLIKSKLSLKNSFKIGSGGLKYKKFRLVMTIILSTIAFTLFGLVDTFSAYNHVDTTANSIFDSNIRYASVTKSRKIDTWLSVTELFSDDDLKKLSDETGIKFRGIASNNGMDFSYYYNIPEYEIEGRDSYIKSFMGVTEVDEDTLKPFGYELIAGRLPNGKKDEIAISEYAAKVFVDQGYTYPIFDGWTYEKGKDIIDIRNSSDLINKTLFINEKEYTIVGIVDTKFDTSRYDEMINSEDDSLGQAIVNLVLQSEYSQDIRYSYTGLMMVGEGFTERFMNEHGGGFVYDSATWTDFVSEDIYLGSDRYITFDKVNKDDIIWIDGEKTKLGKKEIIVTADLAMGYFAHYNDLGEIVIDKNALVGQDFIYYNYSAEDNGTSGYKVVGVLDNMDPESEKINSGLVFSEEMFEKNYSYLDGIYDIAIGAMPEDKADIHALAEFCYGDKDSGYALNNPASLELDVIDTILGVVSKIFMFVGIFFAIFAAILLSNFIATSISYKKQEIGILRAIGARSNDVFRIFFAEAFIIAAVNFVLAFTGTGIITFIINLLLRNIGLLVTVLNFGIRQFLVLALISIGVAFLASFLPVKKIASKRPIDAIRNR